ncbi:MAG TPA: ScyD/ScyE family protein [Bryobacteraceae bacterium]|nr:ScyD/ScyE family protein [Bryobacteraceae bacterium]
MRRLRKCIDPGRFLYSSAALAVLVLTQIAAAETIQTVAAGLDNPRGLNFGPDGALYVAEAGRGGAGPCAPGPEGTRCYGATGAITRIDLRSGQKAGVASGLPSLAGEAGDFAIGPHDIAFVGLGNASITIGFSGDPRDRQLQFGAAGASLARLAGMQAGGNWRLGTDLGLYESANNPTGDEVDSNPYGMLQLPGKLIVADAGGNDLIQVNANGSITTLAVFPDRLEDAPPFLELPPGTKIPMDAVPTNVSLGPDGYYYVGQLTGFPFPAGGANVYRVPPAGGTPQIHAGGFSAIIDTVFGPDGSLYVLEIARNGLLDAFINNNWTGALIRVAPNGTRSELAAGQLIAPGGVAVGSDGSLYVTVNSVYPGTGAVLRIKQ